MSALAARFEAEVDYSELQLTVTRSLSTLMGDSAGASLLCAERFSQMRELTYLELT